MGTLLYEIYLIEINLENISNSCLVVILYSMLLKIVIKLSFSKLLKNNKLLLL